MGIPLRQQIAMGTYIARQRLAGNRRYPLVLMLEPLLRCNLACPGCGKIDFPDAILNRRLSPQECWDAAEECGAPMVAIPGGEFLLRDEEGGEIEGAGISGELVYRGANVMMGYASEPAELAAPAGPEERASTLSRSSA